MTTMREQAVRIGLVKIPVTDFERARAFYRDVLGLEEQFAVEQYGWAQYAAGNLPLCLYLIGRGGGLGKPGSECGFHLVVNDAESLHAAIVERGAQTDGLEKGDDGTRFFDLRDPDGNAIRVTQAVSGED